MSVRFTGDKTALRRITGLPASHADFTICGFAKLLVAAADREATIVYTQPPSGDSAEAAILRGSGTSLQAFDDYGGTYSSTLATLTAGGLSGANWFAFALAGVGSGANGLRLYHSSIGGTPTYVAINNKAGTQGFETIQLGDLPYGTTGWFDGLIAHLKVFDRALTDVEIAAEAARPDPASSTDLLTYHDFDGGKSLGDALVPNTGTGSFYAFTSNPSMSSDEPVFTAGPTLSGADTLPRVSAVAPVVVTSSLPSGLTTVAYLAQLEATGDTPITWSVTSGALPTGLSLSASTGSISGTPSSAGTFAFTVQATNAAGSGSRALQIVVSTPASAPVITTSATQNATRGAAYGQTLTATGTAPITWSVSAGALPTGLSLSSASGLISGTPTISGSFSFTVSAQNSGGTATADFSILVSDSVTPPAEDDGWVRLPRNTEIWVRVPRDS